MNTVLAIYAALLLQLWPFPGPGRAPTTPPITYLIDEGFEGTGTPSEWAASGTYDFDEATVYKEGAQSLKLDSTSADAAATKTITATDELWGKFWWYSDHQTTSNAIVFQLRNNFTSQAYIAQKSSGAFLVVTSGGTNGACTLGTGEDAWIRVWWHFKRGTGSDLRLDVWWATTDTHPGSGNPQYYCSSTNGTATLAVDKVVPYSDNIGTTNGIRYFDSVVAATGQVW